MKAQLTAYWLVELTNENSWDFYRHFDDPEFITLEGMWLPMGFLRAIRMEGCGRTETGKIVVYEDNAWKTIDEKKFPWGIDALGEPLIPFKSMAIDPKVLDMENHYLIRELKGVTLPDGTVYDGVARACDTGGGIKHNHIDLFVGTKDNWHKMVGKMPPFVNVEEVLWVG